MWYLNSTPSSSRIGTAATGSTSRPLPLTKHDSRVIVFPTTPSVCRVAAFFGTAAIVGTVLPIIFAAAVSFGSGAITGTSDTGRFIDLVSSCITALGCTRMAGSSGSEAAGA